MSTFADQGTQQGYAFRVRSRRFLLLVVAGIVMAWSVAEVISLLGRHTVGAEWYGVLVAVLSAAAGIFTLPVIVSARPQLWATVALLVLWAVVGLGGLAGTYYHAVGVSPQYSEVDPRPRPALSPLIFTVFGVVGGAVVFINWRSRRELR
jgi:hypothetical protein